MDDPKALVAASYDRIAETYAAWAARGKDPFRERWTRWLLETLPASARVLDLGCGSGEPTARILSGRFAVTGVDASARQIALARARVPGATFVQAEMTALAWPAASFDAVVALYSITHVPREEHPALLRRIHDWLVPGGIFIATLGAHESADMIAADWLGAPMFFSHHDAATNERLAREAGFAIDSARVETIDEDGVPVEFLWIVARAGTGFPGAIIGGDKP